MPNKAQTKANQRKATPKVYGNKDSEKLYPITQTAIDKGMYVLLHYKNHTEQDPNNPQRLIDTGDINTSTKRIGVYTQKTFDDYTSKETKEGDMFNKMLGKYEILHDPTEGADDEDEDIDELAAMTKSELLEKLNGLDGVTDEDLKFAATPTTKKADIVGLVEKYSNPE